MPEHITLESKMQQRDAFKMGECLATHQISKRDQRCLLPLKGSVDPRPHSGHSPQETLPGEDVGWEGVRVLLHQALLYLLPLDLKELPACSAAWPALWAPQLRAEQLAWSAPAVCQAAWGEKVQAKLCGSRLAALAGMQLPGTADHAAAHPQPQEL